MINKGVVMEVGIRVRKDMPVIIKAMEVEIKVVDTAPGELFHLANLLPPNVPILLKY
jgi:hypothetical protein